MGAKGAVGGGGLCLGGDEGPRRTRKAGLCITRQKRLLRRVHWIRNNKEQASEGARRRAEEAQAVVQKKKKRAHRAHSYLVRRQCWRFQKKTEPRVCVALAVYAAPVVCCPNSSATLLATTNHVHCSSDRSSERPGDRARCGHPGLCKPRTRLLSGVETQVSMGRQHSLFFCLVSRTLFRSLRFARVTLVLRLRAAAGGATSWSLRLG